MTKHKHPINKKERLLEGKKHSLVKDVPTKKERAGRVWRKLSKEQLQEQETKDELKEFGIQHP